MTWRSSSRAKISPLHVTYVSIPSMSICFSCFTNCSTCSWLYGPKPPAPLPVQAAGPAEADPATPAGPVPPLLPVEAAGTTEVDPAAAGPVPVLPVEAAGGLLGGRGLNLGDGGGGWGLGLGTKTATQDIRVYTKHVHVLQLLRAGAGGQKFLRCTSHTCLYQACPCASVASRLFHLLLAVRVEAACATASGSWASRSWAKRILQPPAGASSWGLIGGLGAGLEWGGGRGGGWGAGAGAGRLGLGAGGRGLGLGLGGGHWTPGPQPLKREPFCYAFVNKDASCTWERLANTLEAQTSA